jgi:hypothetical protein
MPESLPEPWLRGILPDLNPVTGHLLRASEQIREDLSRALEPLTPAQLWAKPLEMSSPGFHAKHLAGSTNRLCTYLEGASLTPGQLVAMAGESAGTESAGELIEGVNKAFDRYDRLVRELKPEEFAAVREIGRKRLRTTAIGIAIHIAEHGQRHAGQAINAAKLAVRTARSAV